MKGHASQETPTVVFLVGQPGAGKSRLTELVATQLKRHGGFVDRDSGRTTPRTRRSWGRTTPSWRPTHVPTGGHGWPRPISTSYTPPAPPASTPASRP
ncbi:zeta toxin family protein [Streptomyces sp. SCL15-6]|uniref:zeta toxin family protein n=1 Tax=Streptomyces sp. SCL15-6 TaxID=2967222 RepID=UPI0029667E09|nr:zeta toxin family protein [Streptomyces sp. SCL15-6]